MEKRTEREFHIALGKLLDRVRVQNSWSKDSFHKAAKHVANVSQAEAVRFFKALTKTEYLKQGSDKRKLTQNFKANVWKNQDAMIAIVKEILLMDPDILQERGPKKGSHRNPKITEATQEVLVIQEDIINPLDHFDPQDLVDYLRSKGWVIDAYRDVTVRQTLWWKP